MAKQVYTIDGANFSTLEEFYDEITTSLVPGTAWDHSVGALSDVLRGALGGPDQGLEFHWRNSELSRQRLGYPETVRQLEHRLLTCPESDVPIATLELKLAEARRGPTVFNWLVDAIAGQADVQLVLE